MIVKSRVTRVLAAVLVVIFVTSAVPFVVPEADVTENASAAGPYIVKMGMLQDVLMWNPLAIDLVSEWIMTYLIHSVLFQYDQDWGGPVNDLATGYYQVVHAPRGNMTTYINITQNAYFRSAAFHDQYSTANKTTAADVEFSIETVIANPGSAWDEYVKGITGVNVTSTYQVAIDTEFPKATLIDNLVWIPILPKYLWEDVPKGQMLSNADPDWLVGSGPFLYDAPNSTLGSWYSFRKAPNYHGSTDYPLGHPSGDRVIEIDGLLYNIYTTAATAVFDMNSGALDAVDVAGSPGLFLNELGKGDTFIKKYVTQENGIIDVAINAIPMDFRRGAYGNGNTLLLDPIVRKAIIMTLNKTSIANIQMMGLPAVADSVLPTPYWHLDIDPEVQYDAVAAKALLQANGYNRDLDGDGFLEATAAAYPVVEGWADVGDELSFRLRVPDTDPTYDIVAKTWVGWAEDGGILFNYDGPTAEKTMIFNDWYQADYDVWVWAWYWGPEPLSNLAVWKTEQIKVGGDNCQMPMGPWWYSDSNSSTGEAYSAYDENFSLAEREFNPAARKVITDTLQQWIYDSFTELPPIYPAGLWAVSERRYTGWGNWTEHIGRTFESDLLWLWFDLTPTGANMPPEYDNRIQPYYQIVLGDSQVFTVTAHDPEGDPLTVTWDFGDGNTSTNSSSTGTQNPTVFTKIYTYSSLALPPDGLTLMVNVSDGNPGNNAIGRATVFVIPAPDLVPELTFPVLDDPFAKAYVGEPVTWTAGARDAESGGTDGFGLQFTWVWDDGTYNVTMYQPTTNNTEIMDTVTHVWTVPSTVGTYDVYLYVWDGSELPGHNISFGPFPYEIVENQPPSLPAISSITANRNVAVSCLATSSDPDGDTLRFTWHWDDGTYSVTEATAGPDEMVVSMVDHTWTAAGSYLVEVFVDDLTGTAGHNVTSSITATISNPGVNVAPSSLGLIPTPQEAYPDEMIVFNASAVDTNSDPLTLTVVYGDGNMSTTVLATGSPSRVYADFQHAYELVGDYVVELWADDGQGHNVSISATVTVSENEAPWLILPSGASAYYNMTFTLTPARARDNDTDTLTVWFDWGDGNWSASSGPPLYNSSHVYDTMAEKTVTVYLDDGTGLPGHNVSKTVVVTMNENLRPNFEGAITLSPAKDLYARDEVITFSITVKDYEGDWLNVTVDFGDGTNTTLDPFRPQPNNATTVTVNHSYSEGQDDPYVVTVMVDDGLMQFHSIKEWNSATVSVPVEKEEGKDGNLALWAAIGAAIIIAALLLLLLFMRRRKGEEKPEMTKDMGGMEGMKPPEAPPGA
jgi:peptide/nickel transport system substrate-binding protein